MAISRGSARIAVAANAPVVAAEHLRAGDVVLLDDGTLPGIDSVRFDPVRPVLALTVAARIRHRSVVAHQVFCADLRRKAIPSLSIADLLIGSGMMRSYLTLDRLKRSIR